MTAESELTRLTWHRDFDSPDTAGKLRAMGTDAHGENQDRMEAVLAGQSN